MPPDWNVSSTWWWYCGSGGNSHVGPRLPRDGRAFVWSPSPSGARPDVLFCPPASPESGSGSVGKVLAWTGVVRYGMQCRHPFSGVCGQNQQRQRQRQQQQTTTIIRLDTCPALEGLIEYRAGPVLNWGVGMRHGP